MTFRVSIGKKEKINEEDQKDKSQSIIRTTNIFFDFLLGLINLKQKEQNIKKDLKLNSNNSE